MPVLPSGRYYCIQDHPLQQMLDSLATSGLRIPDLLCIAQASDLRRHLSFAWLLPLGADTVIQATVHSHSQAVPDGLTLVDSGHTLASLPADLDEHDRAAVEAFWESERCQAFAQACMSRVREARKLIIHSSEPEDKVITDWFRDSMVHPKTRAAREELRAALREEGLLP